MIIDSLQYATTLLDYPCKISIHDEFKLPCTRIDGAEIVGYSNIIERIVSSMKLKDADVNQILLWTEYLNTFLNSAKCSSDTISLVLNDLNHYLSTRSYFIGNESTVIDALFYFHLYPIMDTLPLLEQRRYIHVTRWFDNIQQTEEIRQKRPLIHFSSALLLC